MVTVEMKIRNRVIVDLAAIRNTSFTLATLLAEAAMGEIKSAPGGVKTVTRDRRRRSQRTPQDGRYPAGYAPRPSGPLGRDSEYLLDHITANVVNAIEATVNIPKNRSKAAFVRRSEVLDATTPKSRKIRKQGLEAQLKKMVRVVPKTARAK